MFATNWDKEGNTLLRHICTYTGTHICYMYTSKQKSSSFVFLVYPAAHLSVHMTLHYVGHLITHVTWQWATHLNLVLNELDSDTEFLRTSFPIATMSYCTDHVNRSNTVDCDRRPCKRHNFFDSNILSVHRNPVRPLRHTCWWIPCELQKLHFRIREYIAERRKINEFSFNDLWYVFLAASRRTTNRNLFIFYLRNEFAFVDFKCLQLRRFVWKNDVITLVYDVHC